MCLLIRRLWVRLQNSGDEETQALEWPAWFTVPVSLLPTGTSHVALTKDMMPVPRFPLL